MSNYNGLDSRGKTKLRDKERAERTWALEKEAKLHDEEVIINGEIEKDNYVPFDNQEDKSTTKYIDFPMECLPGSLNLLAIQLNKFIKAPLAICAQCIMGPLSLVAQPHINVKGLAKIHPVSLFIATVGESGIRKSTVEHYTNASINEYERQSEKKYRKDKESYDACIKANSKSDIIVPKSKKIVYSDITTEGLIEEFKYGTPSKAIFSDEGGIVTEGYSFNRDNKNKSGGINSKLYDGNPISKTTKGSGTIALYGKRLSWHIMLQPLIAKRFLTDKDLKSQGLLSRCLFSIPNHLFGTRLIDENTEYDDYEILQTEEYIHFQKRIGTLIALPYSYTEVIEDELKFRDIPLVSTARKELIRFYNEVEENMADGAIYAEYRGFASKIVENVTRIAACFEFYENENCNSVSLTNVQRAIEIGKYYLDQTIQLVKTVDYFENTPDENFDLAKELYNWLLKKKDEEKFKHGFMFRIVQNTGPLKFRKNSESLKKYFGVLVERNLIFVDPSKSALTYKLKNAQ